MKTLLLVDADGDSRTVYRLVLQHAGYQVIEAADASEALTHARATQPDLLITEITLPRMDGLALLEAMRREEALAATRLCVLTATVAERLEARCQALGVSSLLFKPIQPSALVEEVGRILSGAPSGS